MWVEQQAPEMRLMLGLAAYQFFPASDTLCLVFPNSAMRVVKEESCTALVTLIQKHYEGRLREWLSDLERGTQSVDSGPELSMPHISIEFAPPLSGNH